MFTKLIIGLARKFIGFFCKKNYGNAMEKPKQTLGNSM